MQFRSRNVVKPRRLCKGIWTKNRAFQASLVKKSLQKRFYRKKTREMSRLKADMLKNGTFYEIEFEKQGYA